MYDGVTDTFGLIGKVPIACGGPSSIQYSRAGQLRALAVTTGARSEALPDIPTVSDFFRDMGRASGPASVRPRAQRPRSSTSPNSEINAALADPKIKTRFWRPGRNGPSRHACRFRQAHLQ